MTGFLTQSWSRLDLEKETSGPRDILPALAQFTGYHVLTSGDGAVWAVGFPLACTTA